MKPHILSETGPWLAVDKPTGWVAHATSRDETHDVRAWLAEQGHPLAAPVHRIDRGTSGVVLYSEDAAARGEAGAWFTGSEVTKTYIALVHGRTHRKGTVRKRLDKREAVTRYTLVETLGAFSLLRVRPATGRKHQIRRHLHGLGHPVVGDDRYRPRRFRPVPGFPERLFLHAWRLELPGNIRFESELPPELEVCLAALRAGAKPDPA